MPALLGSIFTLEYIKGDESLKGFKDGVLYIFRFQKLQGSWG